MDKNSTKIGAGLHDIDSGSLNLFDYCLPPLSAGDWTIKTEQTIIWKEQEVDQSYKKDQSFSVEGPRFTIDPSDVHAIYPPANSLGKYSNIFPHIVLSKRTLPWERLISPTSENTTPWLTLMILEESDIYTQEGEKTQPITRTVNDLINSNPEYKILGPQGLTVSSDELKSPCYTVDVDSSSFKEIIPAATELPFLSHCRQVVLTNKEPLGNVYQEDETGWFSVVVGNRLPDAGVKAFACLVSLEGFEDYLYGASKANDVSNYNAVRLAVLAFWSFTVEPDGTASFAELMTNLDACALKMPKTPATSNSGSLTKAQEFVAEALSDGYVPMTYQTRVGEQTVAWYRGPFSPVILKEDTSILPFFSAEAALIYDQTTGMFDVSYAVAWQIGRLLALSDRSFATNMLQWRQQQSQAVDQEMYFKNMPPEVLNLLDLPEDNLELLPAVELQKRMKDVFAVKLASFFDEKKVGDRLPIMVRDKTGVLNRKRELPGLLSREEIMEAITGQESFYLAIKEKIFNSSGK